MWRRMGRACPLCLQAFWYNVCVCVGVRLYTLRLYRVGVCLLVIMRVCVRRRTRMCVYVPRSLPSPLQQRPGPLVPVLASGHQAAPGIRQQGKNRPGCCPCPVVVCAWCGVNMCVCMYVVRWACVVQV